MSNREPYKKNEPETQGAEEVRDAKSAKGDPKGRQKGPQDHAEGQHGAKTHAAFLEQLHSPGATMKETAANRSTRGESADDERESSAGRQRLVEDREQHDEAEKNSEHNRLYKEYERGRDVDAVKGNLHGVLGHREHRADFKNRGRDGLEAKD